MSQLTAMYESSLYSCATVILSEARVLPRMDCARRGASLPVLYDRLEAESVKAYCLLRRLIPMSPSPSTTLP